MIRRASVLASALVAIAFALVGGQEAAAATLRLGVTADALSTDPIASSDNASIWTELQIYDQLVRPSRDGTKLEPGIAESWSVSADGKEYEFKLRADAKFSDGTPVTAADVEFSLQARRRREIGVGAVLPADHRPISVVDDAHDRDEARKAVHAACINNLAMFSASILPAKLVEAPG